MTRWNQQVDNLTHHIYFRACAFVIIAIGFFTGHPILFFMGSLYLIYFVVSYYYLDKVGKELRITIVDGQVKLFPGETGVIKLKVEQPSWLPIFSGRIQLVADNNIEFQNGDRRTRISQLHLPFSLMSRSETVLEIPFTAKERGVAKLHHIEVQISHFIDFGKVYLQKNDLTKFEALVYSEQLPVTGLKRIKPKNQGSYPTRSSLFEDASTIIGTRDYADGDAFNRIHWKASARVTNLQTKVHEKTSQFSWLIVFDIRSGNMEERIKGITYLLHHATKFNIPFSLLVNIKRVGTPSYFELPYGEGKRHLQSALTIFARLQGNSVSIGMPTFERIAYQHALNSPYVILCGEEERLKGWKMPPSANVHLLDVIDSLCTLRVWRTVARKEAVNG
ncbi:hypothetical protein AB685_00300 [Bacillus sp. LL01]|uniref:DUF58 domain-containing protein n=1 Tax=Bacillus sp. LL01 TaxID=1665556 RepID=UPI00064D0860|nr:DUF58 domain-containing protein [Bacillus sp. LL01]KMJ59368.1 hypothetical protein AB685_00300 [Bacillus sp. LL01]